MNDVIVHEPSNNFSFVPQLKNKKYCLIKNLKVINPFLTGLLLWYASHGIGIWKELRGESMKFLIEKKKGRVFFCRLHT